MTTKDVLALALEALTFDGYTPSDETHRAIVCKAITAIKQAQGNSDSTCNETLRLQGKAYPRTCKKCRFGPCIGKPIEQAQQAQEPVAFISPKQLELIKDPEGEFGHYIPMRKTSAGNFVMALYAAPKQAEPQIHCPEKLEKGGCQLHNLHCGWPKCNAAPTPPEAK